MSEEIVNRRRPGHWFAMGKWGELSEGETLSCVHCQATWLIKKGSGRLRGFCRNCMGPTCGDMKCDACIPIERKIENLEAGRAPDDSGGRVQIFVPPGLE